MPAASLIGSNRRRLKVDYGEELHCVLCNICIDFSDVMSNKDVTIYH